MVKPAIHLWCVLLLALFITACRTPASLPEPAVSGVTITPNHLDGGLGVQRGQPVEFTAVVQAVDGAADTVAWYLDDDSYNLSTTAGTTLTKVAADGNKVTLHVHYYETAETLRITARSTFDETQYAEVIVTITGQVSPPLPQLSPPFPPTLNTLGVALWVWPDEKPGLVGYLAQLYRDALPQGAAVEVGKGGDPSHDFLAAMRDAGPGVYTVTLTAIGDGVYWRNSEASQKSGSQTVSIRARAQVPVWRGSGWAGWTNVSGVTEYVVQLYRNGRRKESTKVVFGGSGSTSYFDFALAGFPAEAGAFYSFTVTARGDDALILDSEPSVESPWRTFSVMGNANVNAIVSGVVNGRARYVAGAANGRIAWSDDGRVWNNAPSAADTFARVSEPGHSVNAIAWGNGRFLAVGNAGRVAFSDDGIEWHRAYPWWTSQNLYVAVFAFDRFYVGGTLGRIRHSPSGESGTWQTISGNADAVTSGGHLFGGSRTIRTLVYLENHPSGRILLAFCAAQASLARTSSGTTGWELGWDHIPPERNRRIMGGAARRSDGYLVLVFEGDGWAAYSAIRGSGNGWEWADHGAGTSVRTIAYGNGRFYIGSTRGRLTIYTPSIAAIPSIPVTPPRPGGTWDVIPVGLGPRQSQFTQDETITALHVMGNGDLIMAGLGKFAVRQFEPSTNVSRVPYAIVSPYRGIDWRNYGQYKAALHSHTTRSDGAHTLARMIEEHYAQGFDILAITDHDIVNRDWVSGFVNPWRPNAIDEPLTPARYDEIRRGVGRNGRGMLRIPYANEQSLTDPCHLNTFFADFNNERWSTLRGNIAHTQNIGGLSHINHPGRTNANAITPAIVSKYAGLFLEFHSCVGMEIVNQRDRHPNDRALWDNILMQTVPQGRFVWGFSNDDSHSIYHVGYSFNMFVMPENNLENFRSAMVSGGFYAVARVARTELGNNFTGTGPVPRITNIEVDDNVLSITIDAQNFTRIVWIADGIEIAQGRTLRISDHMDRIGYYVRANIIGPGGIAFTQPFGILTVN